MTVEQAQGVIALWKAQPPTMDYFQEFVTAVNEHAQAVAVLKAAGLSSE